MLLVTDFLKIATYLVFISIYKVDYFDNKINI